MHRTTLNMHKMVLLQMVTHRIAVASALKKRALILPPFPVVLHFNSDSHLLKRF